MNRKFSPKVKEIITRSRDEALRLGHDFIGTEHLLLGIVKEGESLALRVLSALDVDTDELKETIERSVQRRPVARTNINISNLPLNKQAEKVLKVTFLEARLMKNEEVCPEHVMLSILKHNDNLASRILDEFDVTYEDFKSELEYVLQEESLSDTGEITNQGPPEQDEPFEDDDTQMSGRYPRKGGATKSRTPVLDNFGRDITRLAEEDKLDPIIGRENEIERVSQILSRRKKNNPILIGEPGVGKTAIVEGLALRIMQKK